MGDPMSKLKNKCTFTEFNNYVDTYIATWDSINDCVMFLSTWLDNSNNTNSGERLEIALEKRLLLAKRELLESKRQAFKVNKSAINPPSKKDVKKARKLADEIDEIIRNSETMDAALSVAEQSLKLFNEIQDV